MTIETVDPGLETVFARSAVETLQDFVDSHQERLDQLLAAWGAGFGRTGSLIDLLDAERAHLRQAERDLKRLRSGGLAPRLERRMPTWRHIVLHHRIDLACRRCGDRDLANLERAHIIDRCFDGLDEVSNIAPLCWQCHKAQPIFRPGDEYQARAWFGLPGPEAGPRNGNGDRPAEQSPPSLVTTRPRPRAGRDDLIRG